MLLALLVSAPATAASLARCDAPESSLGLRESSAAFAEHVRSGYSTTYPAALILAESMAELSAALDSQLRAVEPAYASFREAWAEFDRLVRRSPLPRDPALGPVLPGFKRSAQQLEGQLGCDAAAPEEPAEMVPCPTIPIAHLLAVVAGQMHQYLEDRYAENLPEQAAAARELDRTAKALHHVLHDLEAAVPGAVLMFEALDAAFASSMLTDAEDTEDMQVKLLLAAVGESVEALGGRVESCHDAAEPHQGH